MMSDRPRALLVGVHVHPPQAFLRQGDSDQELMEEMAAEKRARTAGSSPYSSRFEPVTALARIYSYAFLVFFL